MDKAIARHIDRTAFRSWEKMADLVSWTKEHLEPAEHKVIALAIGKACAAVIVEVEQKIYALYPELDQERHETIMKYEGLI